MPRLLKRPPIPRRWYRNAECANYDSEMFDPDGEHAETARTICLELCPVAVPCLRSVFREEAREENLMTRGVIRAGRNFTGATRTLCTCCGYAVATGKQGICNACRDYQTCALGCGRMVRRASGHTWCLYCRCTVDASEKELVAA